MPGKAKEVVCSLCSGAHRTQQCPMAFSDPLAATEAPPPAAAAQKAKPKAAPQAAAAAQQGPRPQAAAQQMRHQQAAAQQGPGLGLGGYTYSSLKQGLKSTIDSTLAQNPKLSETWEKTSKVVQDTVSEAKKEMWASTRETRGKVKVATRELQNSVDAASLRVQEKMDFVQMRMETPQLQLQFLELVIPNVRMFYTEMLNAGPHFEYELKCTERLDLLSTAQGAQVARLKEHCTALETALNHCSVSLHPEIAPDQTPRGRDRSMQRVSVLAATAAATSNDVFEKRESFEAKNHELVVAAIEEMKKAKAQAKEDAERARKAVEEAMSKRKVMTDMPSFKW